MQKVTIVVAITVLSFLISLSALVSDSFTKTLAEYDINNIPIPKYLIEVEDKVELTSHSHYLYLNQNVRERHRIANIDPLFVERLMGKLPNYQFRQFYSEEHPKTIYLFFADEFYKKIEGPKSMNKSCSDEGGIYCLINITSSKRNFGITVFRPASETESTIYVCCY